VRIAMFEVGQVQGSVFVTLSHRCLPPNVLDSLVISGISSSVIY
jgi:hypothetical protein